MQTETSSLRLGARAGASPLKKGGRRRPAVGRRPDFRDHSKRDRRSASSVAGAHRRGGDGSAGVRPLRRAGDRPRHLCTRAGRSRPPGHPAVSRRGGGRDRPADRRAAARQHDQRRTRLPVHAQAAVAEPRRHVPGSRHPLPRRAPRAIGHRAGVAADRDPAAATGRATLLVRRRRRRSRADRGARRVPGATRARRNPGR